MMKKFTFLVIAILVASLSFAQIKKQATTADTQLRVSKTDVRNTREVVGTLNHAGEWGNNAIGSSNPGTYGVASKFTADELTTYVDNYITKINVGLTNTSIITSARVAVLTGSESEPVIATEQSFVPVDGLNEIVLTNPYLIPASTDIMIAYEIFTTGGYAIGCDVGPVVTGGNLINTTGLTGAYVPLTNMSLTLNYNFIISATVEDELSPILSVAPNALSFVGFAGDVATEPKTINIIAASLIENITITTTAPFEISTDNMTYSETATMSGNGDVYVRYNPGDSEALNVTGTVVVASEGAESKTINLSAVTYDCLGIETFPYSEGFEEGISVCWNIVDADGDGLSWRLMDDLLHVETPQYTHSGNDAIISESFNNNAALNADNWMFTQAVTLPEDGEYYAQWFETSLDPLYPEAYSVYISTSNRINDIETATPVLVNHIAAGGVWTAQTISLLEFAGQTIYFAFHHQASDVFILALDDFSVFEAPTTPEIALISVTPANGSTVEINTDINLSGTIINNGVDLTSYQVSYSIDGSDEITQTFNIENTHIGETNTFTVNNVRLTTPGPHSITVIVSNPNGIEDNESDNSMSMNINAYSCEPITQYPYIEDFEDGINYCWKFIDNDGDGYNWTHNSNAEVPSYNGSTASIYSESYSLSTREALNPDNWLITPAFELPAGYPASLSFFVAAQDAYYPAEHYGVYVSTTEQEVSDFTLLFEETLDANGGLRSQTPWVEKHVNLSAYAGETIYIAFRHFDCSDQLLLIIDNVRVALEENITTSIDENIASAIAVYPNPSNNFVTITNAEGQNITIVNSLGQVVANIENATANQTIDISNFANGTYFVKVNAEVVKLNVVK